MSSLSQRKIEQAGVLIHGVGPGECGPDHDVIGEALPAIARPPEAPSVMTRLGRLEVYPASRALLVDGLVVEVGGRAFDILMVLIEARGEIVSKDTLMRQVWPTVTVVDSNLKVQLSLLRRALG